MCFRPAEMDAAGPVICPGCGKKLNRTAGQLPSKCPFCQESLADLKDEPMASPPTTAPSSPSASAGGAPKAPSAPKAPAAPSAPKAPSDTSSD